MEILELTNLIVLSFVFIQRRTIFNELLTILNNPTSHISSFYLQPHLHTIVRIRWELWINMYWTLAHQNEYQFHILWTQVQAPRTWSRSRLFLFPYPSIRIIMDYRVTSDTIFQTINDCHYLYNLIILIKTYVDYHDFRTTHCYDWIQNDPADMTSYCQGVMPWGWDYLGTTHIGTHSRIRFSNTAR